MPIIREQPSPHLVREPPAHDEGAHEAAPVPVRRHRHARPPAAAEAVDHAARRVGAGGRVGAVPPRAAAGGIGGVVGLRILAPNAGEGQEDKKVRQSIFETLFLKSLPNILLKFVTMVEAKSVTNWH